MYQARSILIRNYGPYRGPRILAINAPKFQHEIPNDRSEISGNLREITATQPPIRGPSFWTLIAAKDSPFSDPLLARYRSA